MTQPPFGDHGPLLPRSVVLSLSAGFLGMSTLVNLLVRPQLAPAAADGSRS